LRKNPRHKAGGSLACLQAESAQNYFPRLFSGDEVGASHELFQVAAHPNRIAREVARDLFGGVIALGNVPPGAI
jgi:hypothetical protein